MNNQINPQSPRGQAREVLSNHFGVLDLPLRQRREVSSRLTNLTNEVVEQNPNATVQQIIAYTLANINPAGNAPQVDVQQHQQNLGEVTQAADVRAYRTHTQISNEGLQAISALVSSEHEVDFTATNNQTFSLNQDMRAQLQSNSQASSQLALAISRAKSMSFNIASLPALLRTGILDVGILPNLTHGQLSKEDMTDRNVAAHAGARRSTLLTTMQLNYATQMQASLSGLNVAHTLHTVYRNSQGQNALTVALQPELDEHLNILLSKHPVIFQRRTGTPSH